MGLRELEGGGRIVIAYPTNTLNGQTDRTKKSETHPRKEKGAMTKSMLYTVFLEYKGGTYIGQIAATSPAAALPRWFSGLQDNEVVKWGITREELAAVAKSDTPTPITGCRGVWCVSGSAGGGLVLIHLIATDGTP